MTRAETTRAGATNVLQVIDRIAALFKRLGDLEGKLKQSGAGEAAITPDMLATQLKALRLCAAISEEVREAEALLGRCSHGNVHARDHRADRAR